MIKLEIQHDLTCFNLIQPWFKHDFNPYHGQSQAISALCIPFWPLPHQTRIAMDSRRLTQSPGARGTNDATAVGKAPSNHVVFHHPTKMCQNRTGERMEKDGTPWNPWRFSKNSEQDPIFSPY